MDSDSAEVWQAYERALFRAAAPLRIEMLALLANGPREASQNVRRLALLDLFLDDEQVWIIRRGDTVAGSWFENDLATAGTRKVSVRNFVAGLLGPLLQVKLPPGPARTERWWAEYRRATRADIDRQARAADEAPAATP